MTTSICPEELCMGCAACSNVCPLKCIDMVSNSEGFLYPKIDYNLCNNCSACMRVCPANNIKEANNLASPKVYACWSKDENVRFRSASGGVFTSIASQILDNGGVVFGAAYNKDMEVVHMAISNKEDLVKLQNSKYVQSNIGDSYIYVKKYLKEDRIVLFSGTPCQVAGLNAYLDKEYNNLITIDILCHGVPSPGLFEKYVEYIEENYGFKLTNINFRYKGKGWNLVSTRATFNNGSQYILNDIKNSFMYGFSNNLTLRLSCYQCPYTNVDRNGDITLGDFWGIGEIMPFDHDIQNGVSLVLVNTDIGSRLFSESLSNIYSEERTLKEAKYKGRMLKQPFPEPENRKLFFYDYEILEYHNLAKKHLVDKGFKRFIKYILPRTWILKIKKLTKKF